MVKNMGKESIIIIQGENIKANGLTIKSTVMVWYNMQTVIDMKDLGKMVSALIMAFTSIQTGTFTTDNGEMILSKDMESCKWRQETSPKVNGKEERKMEQVKFV